MSIRESIRYGATELKRLYNRNLGLALLISIGAHALLIGLYTAGVSIGEAGERPDSTRTHGPGFVLEDLSKPEPVEVIRPTDPLPPSLPAQGTLAGGSSVAGKWIPIPDHVVDPNTVVATVSEMATASSRMGDSTAFGLPNGVALGQGIGNEPVKVVEREAYPDIETPNFEASEPGFDLTELQKRVKYPEIAVRVGIEGKVIVRVLVDKRGRPINHRVDYSDNKILEKAAVDAVMNTVFSPGVQNGTPVAVWISIPVTFSLENGQ